MSESKFKTMRHIEAVRNYLMMVINEFIERSIKHDQGKLEPPEAEVFEIYTPRLRECSYGSDKYRSYMKEMKVAVEHHHKNNSHHPEYYKNTINGMNLFDLLEMLCDWKAAGLRHDDGNIYRSLEINRERFNMSNQLSEILKNTIDFMETKKVYHKANES